MQHASRMCTTASICLQVVTTQLPSQSISGADAARLDFAPEGAREGVSYSVLNRFRFTHN